MMRVMRIGSQERVIPTGDIRRVFVLSIRFCNFQRICFCASLFFLAACESNKTSEERMTPVRLSLSDLMFEKSKAETVADLTWNELDNGDWSFTVKFIAKEGSSATTEGKPFKNMPITIYYRFPIDQIKTKSGYKPEIKPIKHQKIKIEYFKNEPGLVYNGLENIKYQDEHGQIVELN